MWPAAYPPHAHLVKDDSMGMDMLFKVYLLSTTARNQELNPSLSSGRPGCKCLNQQLLSAGVEGASKLTLTCCMGCLLPLQSAWFNSSLLYFLPFFSLIKTSGSSLNEAAQVKKQWSPGTEVQGHLNNTGEARGFQERKGGASMTGQ